MKLNENELKETKLLPEDEEKEKESLPQSLQLQLTEPQKVKNKFQQFQKKVFTKMKFMVFY